MLYGYVIDAVSEEKIDEVLVLIMKSPRSFTGEDIVEIHCHGGLINVQRIMECVLAEPFVRRALPGEFSQRAVLNGRLTLSQAEAVSDLVAAKSRKAAQLAMKGIDGGIQIRITKLRNLLLDLLTEIEARLDFEDELPILNETNLLQQIDAIIEELSILISDANRGDCLRNGLRVAIVGCTNVGKSSLLNMLSKRE